MIIRIGLENNYEGRSTAWALDIPGCFAYGSEGSEALIRTPQAVIAFKSWIEGYMADSWLADLGDFDIRLVETVDHLFLNDQYEPAKEGMDIGSWFHHDWLPLNEIDIQCGLNVLAWAHNDLIELTAPLSAAQLDHSYSNERWNIRGILRHVANAEWWYLDRLARAGCKREKLPENVYERLEATRKQMAKTLPALCAVEDVRGLEGEFWSPRKILRRAAWHALDHCQHIHKLITQS